MTNMLEIDGVRLSYSQSGTGRNQVVFVHGNSCCAEVFSSQLAHLQESEWSAISVDLPGHGNSNNAVQPEAQYTIPGYARILIKFLNRLGVENPVIVGWSLGGNIAMEMLGQGFGMRALLLMGAPPVGPGPEDFAAAFDPSTFNTAVGEENPTQAHLDEFVRVVYQDMNVIPKAFFEAACRTDGKARTIMGTHWISGKEGYQQRDVVAKSNLPICVVQGKNEPWVLMEYLQQVPWANLWRDEVIELDHCGHAPFVENPEGFNHMLNNFLQDVLDLRHCQIKTDLNR